MVRESSDGVWLLKSISVNHSHRVWAELSLSNSITEQFRCNGGKKQGGGKKLRQKGHECCHYFPVHKLLYAKFVLRLVPSLRKKSTNGTLPYADLPPEAVLANSLGVVIVAFGLVVLKILASERWRRPELRSEVSDYRVGVRGSLHTHIKNRHGVFCSSRIMYLAAALLIIYSPGCLRPVLFMSSTVKS